MKSKGARFISFLLCFLIMAGFMYGCGDENGKENGTKASGADSNSTSSPDGSTVKDTSKLVITVWNQDPDPTTKLAKMSKENAPDLWVKKWFELCEAYMGRPLEFVNEWVDQKDAAQKQMVYISSGITHDVITNDACLFEEEMKLGERGLLVDVTKYDLPYYGPMLDYGDGTNRAKMQSTDGAVYGFAKGSISPWETTFQQYLYRFDVLEKHGLKPAKDLNELYVLLKKLKELYPQSYPFGKDQYAVDHLFWVNKVPNSGIFFDTKGIFFDGTNYFYSPTDKAEMFKKTVEYVRKLYTEGLLDPDFMAPVQGNAKAFTDKTFVVGTHLAEQTDYSNANYPEAEWGAAPIPLGFDGEKGYQFWSFYEGPEFLFGSNRWISTKSKNIAEIVKLLDYQYSEEMLDLTNWGIEGVTYTKGADGKKAFVPEIMNLPIAEREAKKSELLQKGSKSANPTDCDLGSWEPRGSISGYIPYYDGSNFVSREDSRINFFEFTAKYNNAVPLPNDRAPAKLVRLTTDQQDTVNNIMNPVQTYLQENVLKFITGKRDMSEYDSFLAELKKMGDINAAVKIHNDKLAEVSKSTKK